MRTWEFGTFTVETVNYDGDLMIFVITQYDEPNREPQTIYPDNVEDMNAIIKDLDGGIDPHGWEDGLGGTISLAL